MEKLYYLLNICLSNHKLSLEKRLFNAVDNEKNCLGYLVPVIWDPFPILKKTRVTYQQYIPGESAEIQLFRSSFSFSCADAGILHKGK